MEKLRQRWGDVALARFGVGFEYINQNVPKVIQVHLPAQPPLPAAAAVEEGGGEFGCVDAVGRQPGYAA
jgi:hypothetical protein